MRVAIKTHGPSTKDVSRKKWWGPSYGPSYGYGGYGGYDPYGYGGYSSNIADSQLSSVNQNVTNFGTLSGVSQNSSVNQVGSWGGWTFI